MSVYRENARWGALRSEHHAGTASWFGAGVLGIALGIVAALWIPHLRHPEPKLYLGAVALPAMGVWMLFEGARLRRVALRVFERGMTFQDQRGFYEVEWGDIAAFDEQVARGRLLAITVHVPAGTFALPKELRGFRDLRALLAAKTKAPWRTVDVGNLMGRRS